MSVWIRELWNDQLRTSTDIRKWRSYTGGTIGAVVSGGVLGFATATINRNAWVWARLKPSTEQGVLTRYRQTTVNTTSTQQHRSRIWLCSDGEVASSAGTGQEVSNRGYSLQLGSSGNAALFKVIAGTATQVGTTLTGVVNDSVWHNVRLERTAGRIRVRIWDDTATEPSTWNIDEAEDTAVGTGIPALSCWKQHASSASAQFGTTALYGPGVRAVDAPWFPRDFAGNAPRSGRSAGHLRLGPLDSAQPSWLSGTTTYDAATLRRTLSAATSATASLTTPAVPRNAWVQRLSIEVENIALNAGTDVTLRIGFTNDTGTEFFGISQAASATQATLVAGSATRAVSYAFMNTKSTTEHAAHKNIRVVYLPAQAELQFFEGDSGMPPGGWLSGITTPSSTTVIPTIQVIAGATAARTLSFTGISMNVELL